MLEWTTLIFCQHFLTYWTFGRATSEDITRHNQSHSLPLAGCNNIPRGEEVFQAVKVHAHQPIP